MEKLKELNQEEMEIIIGGGKGNNDNETGKEEILGDRVPYR